MPGRGKPSKDVIRTPAKSGGGYDTSDDDDDSLASSDLRVSSHPTLLSRVLVLAAAAVGVAKRQILIKVIVLW